MSKKKSSIKKVKGSEPQIEDQKFSFCQSLLSYRKTLIVSILVLLLGCYVALSIYKKSIMTISIIEFYISNYVIFVASAFVGLATAFSIYYQLVCDKAQKLNLRVLPVIFIVNVCLAIPAGVLCGNYSMYKERKELIDEVSKYSQIIRQKVNQTSVEWSKEGIGVSWPSHNPWPLYLSDDELEELILEANKIHKLSSKYFTENVTVYTRALLEKLAESHIGTFVYIKDYNGYAAVKGKHSFTEKEKDLINNLLVITQQKMLSEVGILNFPAVELCDDKTLYFPSESTTNEYKLAEFAGVLENTMKRRHRSLYLLNRGFSLFMTGREETAMKFITEFLKEKHSKYAHEWDMYLAYILMYKYYTYPAPSATHGPDKKIADYYVALGESINKENFRKVFKTFKDNYFYDKNCLKYYYNVDVI